MKSSTKNVFITAGSSICLSIGTFNSALANDTKKSLQVVKPVQIQVQGDVTPTSSNDLTPDTKKSTQTQKVKSKNWDSFVELRRKYRSGEITERQAWKAIVKLEGDLKSLTKTQQSAVLQTQATLLNKANQPVLASLYAAQALRGADDSTDDDYRRSWQILRDVSREYPLQNLLEIVATSVDIGEKKAPGFGSDWNYFLGNAMIKAGKAEKALTHYTMVSPGDRYYFPAKFQEAMIHLDAGKKLDAIAALKAIAYPANGPGKKIKTGEYEAIKDHANMALGRIYYEERKFRDSIKHFRLVRRTGPQFYDSLFEQSWALFLAGYPNHALGMIHGVRSPFFKDTFNPEATMLASIVYYWMCRYDDSRAELADFMTKHQKSIDALDRYLNKGIKDPKSYYQLFEDTVTGVSSDSLGIPRDVLVMATQQDNLLYVRDQYATVVKELQKLDAQGIFGDKSEADGARVLLEKWAAVLKDDIGIRLHNELKAMKLDYERLYDQGQFLYVELLMSKKDQLLGKELHSSTKISTVSQVDNIKGWGRKTQSWAGDDKNEYWADELGFHIYRLKPMCVSSN
jgi:tetratricopeptide (TPR) repeat protein